MFVLLILLNLQLSNAAASAGHTKDELTIALNSEFETLNPIVNSVMASIYILDATLRPLVALTPEGKPKAVLITEIPSLENKKANLIKSGRIPGLSAQIEILPEAQWGDGVPLTCLDVKAAWQIGRDPLVSTPNREDFLNIEDILVSEKSPKKCTVIFKEARWNFYLNFPRPMPAHIELKVFQDNQQKAQGYERSSQYVRNVTNPGLYNGPYVVSELKPGSHVILTQNSKYFGKAPTFKKIIFKFIMNTAAIESNLRAGNVDMASSSGLTFDQALALEKKVKSDKLPFQVIFVPGVIYSHLDFNLDHPILSELKVRQALAYAFNRDEMVKSFFEGRQKSALHFSTQFDSWYTESPKEIKIYEYSKSKAAKLLSEAGWELGADGYRHKNGKKLSLVVSGAADIKLNEMLQVYLQSAWKQVGVELTVKNYPARVLFGEILRKRNFEVSLYSWVSAPDGSQHSTLSSKMIPTQENSWSGSNRPGWKNAKVDEWLDQVEHEFSLAKRIKLMKKVMRIYTEELPALPLYYRSNNSVIPAELKNFKLSGHVFTEYLEVENWSF
jgi:peptide/nickel transport system substrate-binding protein